VEHNHNAQPFMKVVDYKPVPVDVFKGTRQFPVWAVFEVTVEDNNGKIKEGFMQGDTHNWAFETFEEAE